MGEVAWVAPRVDDANRRGALPLHTRILAIVDEPVQRQSDGEFSADAGQGGRVKGE